jgi:predicted TPR repeat methyltransferase
MSDSVSFDPAAEYYDETRRLTPEASRATVQLLGAEFRSRQPCLEIGVGTGLISLPMHDAGVRMVGLDLSAAMLRKLVAKAGGQPRSRSCGVTRHACRSVTQPSEERSPATCCI